MATSVTKETQEKQTDFVRNTMSTVSLLAMAYQPHRAAKKGETNSIDRYPKMKQCRGSMSFRLSLRAAWLNKKMLQLEYPRRLGLSLRCVPNNACEAV